MLGAARRVLLEVLIKLLLIDWEEQKEIERTASKLSDYSEEESVDWSNK